MNTLYQGKKKKPWRFPFVYTVGWFVISGRQEDRLNAAK